VLKLRWELEIIVVLYSDYCI